MKVIINGQPITTDRPMTILEAARICDIHIPTLCYHAKLGVAGNCGICVVEVAGSANPVLACETEITEGMEIVTDSARVKALRERRLREILSSHPNDCLTCFRSQGDCQLQDLVYQLGIDMDTVTFRSQAQMVDKDLSSPSLLRDMNKCIKCGRCVAVCDQVQGIGALGYVRHGAEEIIDTVSGLPIAETSCIYCGQCINVCPVGAITENLSIYQFTKAVADPDMTVLVQIAPAVKVALGEEFKLPAGTDVSGKLVTALRLLGVDKVFNTDFSADLTIMEEGTEFLGRLNNSGQLPMITSCCPSWVKFAEQNYPQLLPHLSSCKSPQQMFGAIAKTFYAQKENLNPGKICVVSVMPCVTKKFEASRPEMARDGIREVDIVLTTRELAKLIRLNKINFNQLADGDFDYDLGFATGAGTIFGVTGGVMEAAVRTISEVITGTQREKIEFMPVRGLAGVKEAEITLNGQTLRLAVVSGARNAARIMEQIKDGSSPYHFIEVMGCPGGCIAGGGQPLPVMSTEIQNRARGLYAIDEGKAVRKSHENPAIKAVYEQFLTEPNGHLAHELLHTHYTDRSNISKGGTNDDCSENKRQACAG
ncbi:hydrogenase, Fe-only [Desulfotomaculum nigrificans CO-1-SRB]|uniref:Hydrogenase, Fe-only n=1 Tax=Desulfotomaculum nigrificans (strain DSM 14880 / VKM B-2319 / CO-1-SRB) TaxID=868595 RepID=F6B2Q9_DESCC|nr:NADH-dependent [FeFe] hydrogenase, group A6 [Desulfotomaculum nigrificans]AEF93888.1 hydrogenase, Fe-only [Desulfotomaculum nigrificans CO-1-SRB]